MLVIRLAGLGLESFTLEPPEQNTAVTSSPADEVTRPVSHIDRFGYFDRSVVGQDRAAAGQLHRGVHVVGFD